MEAGFEELYQEEAVSYDEAKRAAGQRGKTERLRSERREASLGKKGRGSDPKEKVGQGGHASGHESPVPSSTGEPDPDLADVEKALGEAVGKTAKDEASYLTDDKLVALADACLLAGQKITGIDLYDYEQNFGRRIILGMMFEDGEEITALFSRQSGKTETVSVVVVSVMVILPLLGGMVSDPRITKFKKGVWIGVFGPNYETAGIMATRIKMRLHSKHTKEMLQDPEIGIDLDQQRGQKLALPNGSYVDVNSASAQTKIEGKTYHLIICEETQDIPDIKIRKSIHPMGAATLATLVKIGTPSITKTEFYEACERNRRSDLASQRKKMFNLHYEYDYTVAASKNPRYAKYIEREIERLGYDSDEFRMSYRLHWILERGMFIDPGVFADLGVKHKRSIIKKVGNKHELVFPLSPNVVNYEDKMRKVAGVDIGRAQDSTIVTIMGVNFDDPIQFHGETRHHKHILNWLELFGDDHEVQHPQIVEFLLNYPGLELVMVDATGKGDPICSRLKHDLAAKNIGVKPFVFSTQSKHYGYSLVRQEIEAGRLTYPAGDHVQKQRKWKRFIEQFGSLEKRWRGKYMDVSKPKQKKSRTAEYDYHDDYPDSTMLAVMAAEGSFSFEAEMDENPFFSVKAREDRRIERRSDRRNRLLARSKWD